MSEGLLVQGCCSQAVGGSNCAAAGASAPGPHVSHCPALKKLKTYSQIARPQAALELFPAAGITPVTAESHRQWIGADPLRVKASLNKD